MRRIVLCLMLSLAGMGTANAQVVVSVAAGGNLAHTCYVSALLASRNHYTARDGIGDCNAALNSFLPKDVRAATYDNRGIMYDAAANYTAAWTDFNTAIKLNPDLGDAWLNRGVALIRLHSVDEALDDIQKGIALSPSEPEIGYFDRGVAEETLHRFPEAYADYKKALEIDPGFSAASDALKNFQLVPGKS